MTKDNAAKSFSREGSGREMPRPSRNVLLVSPYGIENRGIRYLSAVLRLHGFVPVLVLFKRWVNNAIEPPSDVEKQLLIGLVKRFSPLVVGFGFGAPYFQIVRDVTRGLYAETSSYVLWGGVYPTVCPDLCIEHADAVCVGEGEFPTLDLCSARASGRDVSDIPNLWTKRDGKVVSNEPRPLIQNLDDLPFPDYAQPNTFFIEHDRLRETDPILSTAEYRIYPTRGCPYSCSYCNNSVFRDIFKGKGKYYRTRSVENVLRELEYARTVLPRIRRVKFDGDVFVFPKPWIADFAEAYPRRVGLPFELLTFPGELDGDDLSRLKRAGLLKVQTGIQSGSDREVNTVYRRKSTGSDIVAFSQVARRAGVDVVYDLIFDNPLATSEDKRALVELLLKLERPFRVYLYSLTVFPRTKLADELLRHGLIKDRDIEGAATKSFRQFRLSFGYPRSREDTYWICLAILSAKSFIPKRLIRRLLDSGRMRRHPGLLVFLARATDLLKAAWIAAEMLLKGELTLFKIRQYGSLKKVISQ